MFSQNSVSDGPGIDFGAPGGSNLEGLGWIIVIFDVVLSIVVNVFAPMMLSFLQHVSRLPACRRNDVLVGRGYVCVRIFDHSFCAFNFFSLLDEALFF